jgi:hypothetical protein
MRLSKIVDSSPISLISLVKRLKNNELINVNKEISNDLNCQLLTTILNGFPIGDIITWEINKDMNRLSYIIDGHKRINAIKEAFINGDYYINIDTYEIGISKRRKSAKHLLLKAIMDSVEIYKEDQRIRKKLGEEYKNRAYIIAEKFYNYSINLSSIYTTDTDMLKKYYSAIHLGKEFIIDS